MASDESVRKPSLYEHANDSPDSTGRTLSVNENVQAKENGGAETNSDGREKDGGEEGEASGPAVVGVFHHRLKDLRWEILGLWARTGMRQRDHSSDMISTHG